MPGFPYLEHHPTLGPEVHLAPSAVVVGKVTIDGPARLGARAVLRGDQSPITLAERAVIGEGTTLHVEATNPTRLESDVWLGDGVVVHASELGAGVRVEDGARVLSGSRIGAGSIVTAGSLVPENSDFPEDSYVDGTPGRRLRETTPEERAETRRRVAAALAGRG